ncbi:hypothetical protein FRX31_017559 [Thalictrum thalictroides]|uniref:Uncharacterized protein n=1 Tax=Thalictrum thalictroides TaxID=46969 RepID=A0A7J6W9D9_THATH|nr:hypothetical protein FRX31_017559 [Thalictrum thalictroides]
MENGRGSFLQLTVFKRNARRRFSTVRIPAGSNLKGWGSLGEDLRSFFDQKEALKEDVGKRNHGQDRVRTQDEHWRAAHPGASSGEKDIHVNYTGQSNLASWWSPVVICKSNCSEPDWVWFEKKVKEVFNSAMVKVVKREEAMICLQSESEAKRLLDMPPLVNWEGSFNFFKWETSSGSFTVDDVIALSKKVKVNFHGIPYHLKSKEIVQSLANRCGSRWDILEETINPSSDRCSVMMHNIDFSKIPRVIFLVDKEIRSPVMVEVEGCFLKGGWEPTRPEHLVVGSLPEPILVGHVEGSQTRHGSKGIMSVELSKPPGYEHALGQTNGREFQNSNFVNDIRNEGQFYVSNNPFEVLAMQDLQSAQNSLESGEESIKSHTSSLLVGELRPMEEPKDDGSDGEPLSPVY